jgi:hypothetical protein
VCWRCSSRYEILGISNCVLSQLLRCCASCALSLQDERLGELDTHPRYAAHRLVLTKMHREQIIRKAELEGFTAVLMPHQKAVRD